MTNLCTELHLHDFTFQELFTADGLYRLDQYFLQCLKNQAPDDHQRLLAYRENQAVFTPEETSEIVIQCAIHLENFLAAFFQIEEAVAISQIQTTALNPISVFKKYYVLRRAKKEFSKLASLPSFTDTAEWLEKALTESALTSNDKELAIALLGCGYLADAQTHQADIDRLVAWCAHALYTPEAMPLVAGWTSFHIPERIDYDQLVAGEKIENDKFNRITAHESNWRLRDGFVLTDPRMTARQVQDEVNYCVYCHDNAGDFCSKGFPVKKGSPELGFKKNPLDVTLAGCPLDEKISEMNALKLDGHTLASLAVVMIDNPMCPATGHRICNDCMKACIYQKQEPVNIPQIETRVLTDVLSLPWGVELYDLLTRWNPLRQTQWVAKPYNGLKVLIAGMGPAGFTLAHHLLMEGFAVVGFDGLKIEPLPAALLTAPINDFNTLREALDERVMAGFGGVAEYGITVRWDKNFLKLIYLTLARRPYFQVFGGIRFGGTITVEDAWKMGFDHFVVAVGAGLPKALPITGSMAPGMRQANDFLMALQLGNAAKKSSLTNLQIRLPAVIIGGGLTGVDTATEVQAYYVSQVEKIVTRFDILKNEIGEEAIFAELDAAGQEILAEYLRHGRAIQKEREQARANRMQPNFIKLVHEWGGVTIAYRRTMKESPAYINNHEELISALREGIFYAECLEPIAADLNEFGHVESLVCHKRLKNEMQEWVATTETVHLPARSILVATGTSPNTAYEFEHRGTFNRLKMQYQHYEDNEGELVVAHGVTDCKDKNFGPFTSYNDDHHRVSLIGDTHPVFHGNVVKAIASGMRTYPKILALFQQHLHESGSDEAYQHFAHHIREQFTTTVTAIKRQTESIVEITIKAPLVARHFKAGQFCRLQNFETFAPKTVDTLFQIEPLALPVAKHDEATGSLTFLIKETNAASKLCGLLKPNEPVSLMGPTGVRAKIPNAQETILIIGNQASFPFLLCYGAELRKAGNHVIFIGHFESAAEVYCQDELEAATDQIIWVTQHGAITSKRESDVAFNGMDLFAALTIYQQAPTLISLEDCDRVYLYGDTHFLRRCQQLRKTLIKDIFVKDPAFIGSVYGNMQCMLKGVCAQCLQWQIDPETGQRTKAVFACSWQDQPLEIIDIDHMDARAEQNSVHEALTKLWIDYALRKDNIQRI